MIISCSVQLLSAGLQHDAARRLVCREASQSAVVPDLSCPAVCPAVAGDGTGEGLVAAYYAIVGWPTFLPTNEQVHKQPDLSQLSHTAGCSCTCDSNAQ